MFRQFFTKRHDINFSWLIEGCFTKLFNGSLSASVISQRCTGKSRFYGLYLKRSKNLFYQNCFSTAIFLEFVVLPPPESGGFLFEDKK